VRRNPDHVNGPRDSSVFHVKHGRSAIYMYTAHRHIGSSKQSDLHIVL